MDLLSLLRGEQLDVFSFTVQRSTGDAWFVMLNHPGKRDKTKVRVGSGSTFGEAWDVLVRFEPG